MILSGIQPVPGRVDCWSTALPQGCGKSRAARDSRLTVDSTAALYRLRWLGRARRPLPQACRPC
ncbi:MAG: hypothetical protein DI592_24540 [Stenotrophomonas maltophilia]|nr:MAG: hypothetical protein DI592_24540 [Stenotrophomonas maltophilia]